MSVLEGIKQNGEAAFKARRSQADWDLYLRASCIRALVIAN